mmetsp:Transcript_15592/g.46245  ORF Transcript_15592/g.46245 Transcript_15592/m.46245 type:complete len:209 (-) Transcript_15592:481-1107(-)
MLPITLPTSFMLSMSRTSVPVRKQIGDGPSHSNSKSGGNWVNANALHAYICGEMWFTTMSGAGMLLAMNPAVSCTTQHKALIMFTEKPADITTELNIIPTDSPLKMLAKSTATNVTWGCTLDSSPHDCTMITLVIRATTPSIVSSNMQYTRKKGAVEYKPSRVSRRKTSRSNGKTARLLSVPAKRIPNVWCSNPMREVMDACELPSGA